MTSTMPRPQGPVAYIMKRYPRLTETFILNEIRAMERLGTDLRIISILQPEPPPHHPMVAQVQAPVIFLPPAWPAKLKRLAGAHLKLLALSPRRYATALGKALVWSTQARSVPALWKHFARAGFVAAQCKENGVVHIHAHFANTPTAVAQFASLMSGIAFSFTAHAKDLYLSDAAVIRRRAEAARFVATCTGYNVNYLNKIAPLAGEKIKLIYHGIDLDLFDARKPDDQAVKRLNGLAPLILSVGRLVPKKGLDDLIAACRILHAMQVPFRCRIIGEGPLRPELTALIEAVGLAGAVTLEGAMTHAKLIALYAQADLFALPPRIADDGDRDGIPNVIAEAMAIGVPVVSTDVSGIPELVRDGQTGLLVPPRNPKALAAAMASLLRDEALAQRLAAAGRALLEQDFDLWTTTKRLHGLIECAGCDAAVSMAANAAGMGGARTKNLRADEPVGPAIDQKEMAS